MQADGGSCGCGRGSSEDVCRAPMARCLSCASQPPLAPLGFASAFESPPLTRSLPPLARGEQLRPPSDEGGERPKAVAKVCVERGGRVKRSLRAHTTSTLASSKDKGGTGG